MSAKSLRRLNGPGVAPLPRGLRLEALLFSTGVAVIMTAFAAVTMSGQLAAAESHLLAAARDWATLAGLGGKSLNRAGWLLAMAGSLSLFGAAAGLFARGRRLNPLLERLAKSEESFRLVAETVPSILFAAGADGRFDYVNGRFYEFTRMPAGAALGFGWKAAVHPEDRERVLERLGTAPRENGEVLKEIRLRDGQGEYRWMLVRLLPVRGSAPGDARWFGSAVDIDQVMRSEAALRAAHAQLAAVLAGIDECYCTVDRDFRLTAVNANGVAWLGKEPAEVIGQTVWDVVPVLADTELGAQLRAAIGARSSLHAERESSIKPGQWIELHAYPWADGLSVFFRDVTRRKLSEDALRQTHALLQGTIDALSAEVVVIDAAGAIIAENAAWQRRALDDAPAADRYRVGAPYLAACQRMLDPVDFAAIACGLRAVLDGSEREFRIDCACRAEGEVEWLRIRVARFEGDQRYIVIAHQNVTDIKRAEMALRELAGRLLHVQDEERRRIARDLHDSTAQTLVGALLTLDALRQRDGDSKNSALDELRGAIEQSIQELRTLSYLLHPPLLEELGLASALKWFIRGFEKRSGIRIDAGIATDLRRMPAQVESALFRVVQEALTNVHRHSGSATAQVWLAQDTHEAVLEISDQGSGIAEHAAPGGTAAGALGVGISGMRVRLQQLGGQLDIRSTASGTTIRARVPLGESQHGARFRIERAAKVSPRHGPAPRAALEPANQLARYEERA